MSSTELVDLTATLTDTSSNPLGSMSVDLYYKLFSDSGFTHAGTFVTDPTGKAVDTVSLLVPDSYNVKAVFSGTSNYSASTGNTTFITGKTAKANGSVSAQVAAGETIHLTLTQPDQTIQTGTAITDALGHWSQSIGFVMTQNGSYSLVAEVDADSEFQTEISTRFVFTVSGIG